MCSNVPECALVLGLNVPLLAVDESAEIPLCKACLVCRHATCCVLLRGLLSVWGNHSRDERTQKRKFRGNPECTSRDVTSVPRGKSAFWKLPSICRMK